MPANTRVASSADYFLKLESMGGGPSIVGESTDAEHKGEIEVQSFSWGLHQSLSIGSQTTGAGAGKAQQMGISFSTHVSSASPSLMHACAAGQTFNATLTVRKAGGSQEEYLKVYFTTVAISDYRSAMQMGSTDVVPRDEFSLVFGTCQMEYKPQNKDGTLGSAIKKGWNFIRNVSI